ncbi:MAG: NAD-dependent epimerase/dehydratase family protein [Anaerolineales bacterium]
MSNALVTGAAGFIGGHLLKGLLDAGSEVIAVDDFSTGKEENLDPRVNNVIRSVAGKVPASILRNIDTVYHFGEMAAENLSLFAPDEFYLKNVISTYKLIISSVKAKVRRFVFASSMAVYGNSPVPYREQNQVDPQDPYGLAKYQGERILDIYGKLGAIEIVNVRLYNVYGPNINLNDPYRGVVGIFINQLMNNKSPVVFGDGNQQRAFTFVDDIIPFIIQLGYSQAVINKAINLGGNELTTINQLVQIMAEHFHYRNAPRYFDERINEKTAVYCSTDRAKEILGFQAQTSISQGLKKTIEWAKTLSPVPQFNYGLYKGISVLTDRLPEPWKSKTM